MAASKKTTSIQPKHDQGARRVNMRMMQNVLLIWLDANIDESNADCQEIITCLRRVTNTIHTYTDGDECIEFLERVHDDKVCMVISAALDEDIIPRVHDMLQVDSIFIFSGNKQHHDQWTKDWSKVKGVYTDINLICDALKQSVKDCEQDAIGFSLVATGSDFSNMNLGRLDLMFMCTQIIKEILLVIKFEQKQILNFTKCCREMLKNNKKELNNVNEFELNYQRTTPISWYTGESFVYPMLNRALRLADMYVIAKMGFFMGRLYRQIEKLHRQQFSGSKADTNFVVFRGQGMSRKELRRISKTKGGLIAFNNFLLTSGNELTSMGFAERALSNPKMLGVLFEMQVDPKQSTTPFASVAAMDGYDDKEDEILFAMHSVFRIRSIRRIGGNERLFRVKLELTGDNDQDLQVLTKRIRGDTSPDAEGWERLGLVLWKLGRTKQAEDIWRVLLEQESNESHMGYLYDRLGSCKKVQGENDEAVQLYEKAIAMKEIYHPNSLNLVHSYNNLGMVYYSMDDHANTLMSYEKALAIQQQLLPPTHPDLTVPYNNIGNVYFTMGESDKALAFYEETLKIDQRSLPRNHPDLASTYDNIGLVYEQMQNYSEAYSFYEKAVQIAKQSLSSKHPNLKKWKNHVNRVKSKL